MSYNKNPDGTYSDLEYTQFPAQIDSWQNSEDLTANFLDAANNYKSALLSGNYDTAQNILNSNPQLKRMMIRADDINKLKHATMALERLFAEDIEQFIKSYTDKASTEAEKATTAAGNASISEKNAEDFKTEAEAKAAEANQLVETLRTLKGTLPSDFTEYTQQIADAKTEFNNTISEHNTSTSAHQDIRTALANHTHTLNDIVGSGTLPIEKGGTGASTANDACLNLGALPSSGGTITGSIYLGSPTYYITPNGTANFNKAYGAVYNDYAEFFPRGEETQPGDIIALDLSSQKERYIKASNKTDRVVGVHSDEFAHLIGGECQPDGMDYFDYNIKNYIPVSLAGRVKVRVIGPIHTGDVIIPSETPGVGRALANGEFYNQECVVGYAVEGDNHVDERRIRVRVGR